MKNIVHDHFHSNNLLASFERPEDLFSFIYDFLNMYIEISIVHQNDEYVCNHLTYEDAIEKIYFNTEHYKTVSDIFQGILFVKFAYKAMSEEMLFSFCFDCSITILKTYYYIPVIEINFLVSLLKNDKKISIGYFGDHHATLLGKKISDMERMEKLFETHFDPESENFEFVKFKKEFLDSLLNAFEH